MPTETFEKIKQANLVGRGGAACPVYKKWLRVSEAQAATKVVVCNAAEGEPGIRKDIHILKNSLELVFAGMKLALDFLQTKNAYIFIKEKSKAKIQPQLDKLLAQYNAQGYDFKIFIAPPKYVAGERNTLMSAIEGKILQPIIRQPSPSINGINGQPTLVQNVETFYNIAQAERGEYQHKRFTTINLFDEHGVSTDLGVYEVDNNSTIKKILEEIGHWPNFSFFVQVGGSASGVVLNSKQTETEILTGSGGIDIIPTQTKPRDLLLRWFKFYSTESCGKCAPCFKGSAELYKIVTENQVIPWERVLRLSYIAKKASFCGLGRSIAIPVESFVQNIVFSGSKVEKGRLVKEETTNPAVTSPNPTISPGPGSSSPLASSNPTVNSSISPSLPTTQPTPTPVATQPSSAPVTAQPNSTPVAPTSPPVTKATPTPIAPTSPPVTQPDSIPMAKQNSFTPTNIASPAAAKPKIKVGLFNFTCSEDPSILITILMSDYLLEWKKRMEFVEARILRKHRPGIPLDVAFVEGAITSDDQIPRLQKIRQRSKKLIAIGSCACTGSPANIRNKFDQQAQEEIKCVLQKFHYADKVRKVSDIVPVDGLVPGCPMNTKIFLKVLNKVFVEYGFEPVTIKPDPTPGSTFTSHTTPVSNTTPTTPAPAVSSPPASAPTPAPTTVPTVPPTPSTPTVGTTPINQSTPPSVQSTPPTPPTTITSTSNKK